MIIIMTFFLLGLSIVPIPPPKISQSNPRAAEACLIVMLILWAIAFASIIVQG